jgi:hypothetical protein
MSSGKRQQTTETKGFKSSRSRNSLQKRSKCDEGMQTLRWQREGERVEVEKSGKVGQGRSGEGGKARQKAKAGTGAIFRPGGEVGPAKRPGPHLARNLVQSHSKSSTQRPAFHGSRRVWFNWYCQESWLLATALASPRPWSLSGLNSDLNSASRDAK